MPRVVKVVRQFFPQVRRVRDANKSLTVNVTERDTKSAAVRSHKACAMAVACKRQEHANGVIVSVGTAYVVKGGTAIRFKVPDGLTREIVAFDRKGGFAPGNYRLLAPTGKQKIGGRGSNYRYKPRARKAPRHYTTGIRSVLGGQFTYLRKVTLAK